jgi:hypothetical protein
MRYIGPMRNAILSTDFSVNFTHQDEGKFVSVPKHYAIKPYLTCSADVILTLRCTLPIV